MIKKLASAAIFACGILGINFELSARIIDSEEAQAIATQFTKSNYNSSVLYYGTGFRDTQELSFCQKSADGNNGVYVFSGSAGGFTVVAASDKVENPVLGYSYTGVFSASNIPANMMAWLEDYAAQVQYIEENLEYNAITRPDTRAEAAEKAVEPLLGDIMFDQEAPYNQLCPMKNGVRTVTGCVATAVSQVMKYYNHPAVGVGSHSYSWNGRELSVDFAATPFDWDNILPAYENVDATPEQKEAVATLMYAVGVSCDMAYNTSAAGGSGAVTTTAVQAMIENFKYSRGAYCLQHDATSTLEFEDAIRKELYAGHPVIYTGRTSSAGHCFVVDGCDTKGYFHVNWGWSGLSNGYFLTSAMDPYSQGAGGSTGGFNLNQQAFLGIQPAGENDSRIPVRPYLVADNVKVDLVSIQPDRGFQINISNIYSYALGSVYYVIGWGVFKDTDNLQHVYLPENGVGAKLNPNYGFASLPLQNCKITEPLEDGDYRIYILYGDYDGDFDTQVLSVNKPGRQYVKLFVRDGVYYFNEYVKPPELEYSMSNEVITGDLKTESSLKISAVVQCNVKQENSVYKAMSLCFIDDATEEIKAKSKSTTLRKEYTTGALLQFSIVAPADSGVYRLAVIDAEGAILCKSTDTYKIIGESGGVLQVSCDDNFNVYAVSDGVMIENDGKALIEIYNVAGIKVAACNEEGKQFISIAPGLYVVVNRKTSVARKIQVK